MTIQPNILVTPGIIEGHSVWQLSILHSCMSSVGSQCSQSKCSHGVWPCMVICELMAVTIFCTHFLLGHLSLVYGLLSFPCSPSLLKSHMQLPFHVEIYSDWMFLNMDIPYGLCPWDLFQRYESFIKSLQITMG
jgi:hypothetical protein